MPDIHAKTCSPSGAEGWFACAGRIVMETGLPDNGNEYSDDGTARHWVCATCAASGDAVSGYVGSPIALGPGKSITYLAEWVDEDQDYVDTVRKLADGGDLFVERVVNFEAFTQVPGDSFGTADAIILKALALGQHELIVIDRKTGYHEVEVERNKQLMLYALGAYAEFGMVYDIARVRLIIHQRAAREWDTSIDELLKFGELARSKACTVQNAIAMHGKVAQAEWNATFLNPDPSEDACRYCKAMATCPAMRAKVETVTGADFNVVDANLSPLDVSLVPAVSIDFLAVQMSSVSLVEDWCKAVRAETERRLLRGVAVPGFGLELGKQGNRKWSDEAQAEAALKAMRLKKEEMYDFSLISPTTAEALAKAKKDGPPPVLGDRQWKKLQPLITRAPAKPSVKPLALIKEPYTPPNVADDFQVVEAGSDLC